MHIDSTPENVNDEINLLLEITDLFQKLSKRKFKEYEMISYVPHRNLGRYLFTANRFDEALEHLEIANRLYDKHNILDSINNSTNTKRMIARCMINIGLRDSVQNYIDTAKKTLANLQTKEKNLTIQSLIDEIRSDLILIDGIENDQIITTLDFVIPFPLKLIEGQMIDFSFEGIKCSITSSLIQSKLCPFESDGFIEMDRDKHGLSVHSEIKLSVHKYIEPRNTVIVSNLTKEVAFKPLVVAINVLNKFIDYYKVATSDYWIPKVTHKMLTNFQCEIHSNGVGVFSSPYSGNGTYRVSEKPSTLVEKDYANLLRHIENEDVDLWELQIANAKDYILVKSFRESVIAINSAFENFLAIKVPEVLNSEWQEIDVQSYLNGNITYSDFYLKEFINEDDFNNALKSGIIKKSSPSTYHMIKTCCRVCKMKESARKYNSLVNIIRNGRNEVAHGNKIIIEEENVLKSLFALDEFISLFRLSNN